MSEQSVVLFGGGLDSGCMVESLCAIGSKPHLVHFFYGQKAFQGEQNALHYFARKHRLHHVTIDVPDQVFPDSPITNQAVATEHAQNYLPGRNMVFAALAFPLAVRLGAPRIFLGASPADASSVYHDAKKKFAEAFNAMTSAGYGEEAPRLQMPLVEQRREDYLIRALKTEPDLFRVTFSCYEASGALECGGCTHCIIKASIKRSVEAELRGSKKTG